MHSSFGRVDALFVIAMKDQPLLRDLKMQFPKTATPQLKAEDIALAATFLASVTRDGSRDKSLLRRAVGECGR
jgi:hypothetical protein